MLLFLAKSSFLACLFVLVCAACEVEAATLRVPSTFPTIRDGVNAASAGDTVLVASGTYGGVGNHSIVFRGKDIVVRSEHGADSTTIRLDYSWRAFLVDSGETRACAIEGFRIIQGQRIVGAAVACFNGSLTISNCRFEANSASSFFDLDGYGGGVYTGSPQCTLLVESCEFADNIAFVGGAAMVAHGSRMEFRNCIFRDNEALLGHGGAIAVDDASISMFNCTVSGNVADSGGAISLYHDATMSGSFVIMSRNQALKGGAGAIDIIDGSLINVSNFTMVANTSPNSASHIRTVGLSTANLFRCILAFGQGPAVASDGEYYGYLQCTDIFGNAGGDWTPIIIDQLGQENNFTANPLFCDTAQDRFWIQGVSPCRRTASPCGILIGAEDVGCDCCLTYRGDVNNDGAPGIDISDLTYLIRYFYKGGDIPGCGGHADVDWDYGITSTDVIVLIDYMFRGGPEPPPCL